MSEWSDHCETILTGLNLPFDFKRFDCSEKRLKQLPDTYIVYFMVDDPPGGHADGKETSHEPRIQVSLFYRKKSTILTIPDLIESTFMANGFTRVGSGDIPYQQDTGHYGWRCDFRFYERR